MRSKVIVILMAVACAQSESNVQEARTSADTQPEKVLEQSSDTLIAWLSADTVRVVRGGDHRWLVWTTYLDSKQVERFRSGDLLYGEPEVQLAYINADSVPDLFVTFWYEEFISGMLRIGTPDGGSTARYTSNSETTCRPPELADVTRDGRPDIVEHQPGAATLEDCRGESENEICIDMYGLTWRTILAQTIDGTFVPTQDAVSYYTELLDHYRDAAVRMRGDNRCESLLPGLGELIRQAAALAGDAS